MTKPEAKYYQECEFCHKIVETVENGLLTVKIPARHIPTGGLITETVNICSTCRERLYVHLAKALDLKHIEYGGTTIHWIDDVMDEETEVTDEN